MKLTAELLQRATGSTPERAALFADHLSAACAFYEINTPARLAAFLAQVGHESGSLHHVREVWGPTSAQDRYEGRADLGNTQPGDGRRYAGHGLIQTTGRYNHRAVRDRLVQRGIDAPDFEAAPDLLTEAKWAAWSAADYWDWKNCNALADAGSFEAITVKINGGLNGQQDRIVRWERAKDVMATQASPAPETAAAAPYTPPRPDAEPYVQPEANMPIPAIVTALLPTVVQMIPRLATIFKPGSEVAARNVAAATAVIDMVTQATESVNAQAAVEKIKADPAALAAATRVIENRWFELTEAGGGGVDGARAADKAAMTSEGPWWQVVRSPSFVVALLLLPMVYLILGNVAGLYGANWSQDARAGISGSIAGGIVMGLIGYYYGQTTSRNRAPPAP